MESPIVELKEDSLEKLAAVAGKPTKFILFAQEINDIVAKLDQHGGAISGLGNQLTIALQNYASVINIVENIQNVQVKYLVDTIAEFEANFNSKLKIAVKGEENVLKTIEPGDIVFGLLDDGITFIPFGKYNGGGLGDINNYSTNPIEF